jgi:nucleoside-diphosphate-sugar epimerase
MKVFVTGGSGFVGRYMIRMLCDRGDEVIALARSDRAAIQVTELGASVVRGDLLDELAMSRGMQGCDVVFHIAGFLSMWGKYQEFYETNVVGTECTLAAARAANVPCFVQIGAAASVFDREPLSEIDESQPLQQPKFSPYIATKSIAERQVIAANRPGFKTAVVRPAWIWGTGDHVVPQLVAAVKSGQFIWIDRGNYSYMTTHAMNACHGAILAAQRSPGGQAYFLGDGDVIQFREWVTALLQVAGVQPGKLSMPGWMAWQLAGAIETRTTVRLIGQELTFTDRKARAELGYTPIMTRERGVAELHQAQYSEHLRAHR